MTTSKVILADGCFDVLHIGHLLYLEAAARMGNQLFVGVTRDAFVNKGPGRPVNKEQHRLQLVEGLRCVNFAFLCNGSIDAMEKIKPDIWVKGADYINLIQEDHKKYCEENTIEIRFTRTPMFSATKIIQTKIKELIHDYL